MLHKAPTPAPALTVIEGGRQWRAEEAHVELLAFLDEAEVAAMRIIDAIAGLPVPSIRAINEAGKIAWKAQQARAEYMALTTPDPAA